MTCARKRKRHDISSDSKPTSLQRKKHISNSFQFIFINERTHTYTYTVTLWLVYQTKNTVHAQFA